jgi:hypothetical protein
MLLVLLYVRRNLVKLVLDNFYWQWLGECVWNLWRTEWRWGRFCSEYFSLHCHCGTEAKIARYSSKSNIWNKFVLLPFVAYSVLSGSFKGQFVEGWWREKWQWRRRKYLGKWIYFLISIIFIFLITDTSIFLWPPLTAKTFLLASFNMCQEGIAHFGICDVDENDQKEHN